MGQYVRMMPLLILIFLMADSGLAAKDLFTIPSPLSRSLEPCCDSDNVLSCVDVEVDPEALLNEDDISINGVDLVFSNFIPPHARTYKTEIGDEDDADDRVFDDNININATENMRQGQKTYSIMFYYTPEFAAVTPDIEDFIDQAMATLNQGYANSKIPITATKFCSELSTITEEEVGNAKRLGSFRKS